MKTKFHYLPTKKTVRSNYGSKVKYTRVKKYLQTRKAPEFDKKKPNFLRDTIFNLVTGVGIDPKSL